MLHNKSNPLIVQTFLCIEYSFIFAGLKTSAKIVFSTLFNILSCIFNTTVPSLNFCTALEKMYAHIVSAIL